MLVIREEQIQRFIANDEEELVKSIKQHIREENSEKIVVFSDEMFEEMVRTGIKRAKSHGFERAEDIAAFVAVMFEIAPNFDEQPEIKKILDDSNIPGEQKFERFWEQVSDESWKKAEANYDSDAWFPNDKEE
jgi:predicted small metal-binding protein